MKLFTIGDKDDVKVAVVPFKDYYIILEGDAEPVSPWDTGKLADRLLHPYLVINYFEKHYPEYLRALEQTIGYTVDDYLDTLTNTLNKIRNREYCKVEKDLYLRPDHFQLFLERLGISKNELRRNVHFGESNVFGDEFIRMDEMLAVNPETQRYYQDCVLLTSEATGFYTYLDRHTKAIVYLINERK